MNLIYIVHIIDGRCIIVLAERRVVKLIGSSRVTRHASTPLDHRLRLGVSPKNQT